MNPEVKKLWLDALKSNKYSFSTGYYKIIGHDKTFYCAMGVLYELYDKYQLGEPKSRLSGWEEGKTVYNCYNYAIEADEWAGISSKECAFIEETNDGCDSYEPIITYIENNL